MTNTEDVRWKQRFENYRRSLSHLKEAVSAKEQTKIVEAATIQFFEITLELGWKMLKDYLKAEKKLVTSPRDTIKQAFEYQLIDQGDAWFEALDDRNRAAHIYSEDQASKIYHNICDKHLAVLNQLEKDFQNKLNESNTTT